MHINTRRGEEGIVSTSDDPEKIFRSNTAGPSMLPVAAKAGDNRVARRDENISIGTSSVAEVLAWPLRRPDM